jgi:hypothetical protein
VDNTVHKTLELESAVLSFYVMLYGRHWSAPFMLAALAGVIHERQGTESCEYNGGEDDC